MNTTNLFLFIGLLGLAVGQIDSSPDHSLDPKPKKTRVAEVIAYEIEPVEFPKPKAIESIGLDEGRPPFITTALGILRAMKLGDVRSWIDSWDAGGKTFYGERLEGPYGRFPKRSEAMTRAAWEKAFKDSTTYLVGYVETPSFVVVAYEVQQPECTVKPGSPGFDNRPTKEGLLRSRLVLRKDGDDWVQTGRFANHPIALLWHSGRKQMTRRAATAEWTQESVWPPAKQR